MTWVKAGETTHWQVWYLDFETGSDAMAAGVLAKIEADHAWLASFWTGVTWQGGTTSSTKPSLHVRYGGSSGPSLTSATWGGLYRTGDTSGWSVQVLASDVTGYRSGFIAEVTEEWEFMQNKGLATQPTEGSNGEALSLFFMEKWQLAQGLKMDTGGWYIQNWLNGGREDGVNYSYGGDYMAHQGELLCGVAFLHYLETQLGYTINQVIAAGAPTFAQVYRNLTGRTDDPFPYFMELLETVYPSGKYVDLTAQQDPNNPFPILPASIKYFHNGAWVLPADLQTAPPPNTPPTAAFNYTPSGLTVKFDGSASKPGSAPISTYAWNFGDGSALVTGINATHTYASAGTYTVQLSLADSAGLTAQKSQALTLTTAPPVADFATTVTGLSVAFDSAMSTGGSGTITSYAWTFGDGGTATTAKPTHVYSGSGTFTVGLTIKNSLGASDSVTNTVTVSASTAGYEYLGTSTPKQTSISLTPAGKAVNQALVHDNNTGEFWVTQATASGLTTYTENTRIVRMSSTGALLGQMILQGAGHGLTLNVDYQGSQPFVWACWHMPASGSTRTYDIVRFPWSNTGTTVQDRDTIANLDVMIPGGTQKALHIDWEAQRACLTSFGSASLYNLNDIWARGTLYPLKTVSTPYTSAVTWQGFCTYNDSLFYLFGGGRVDGDSVTADPREIWEYSWQTGQKIKTLTMNSVGMTGTNTWTNGGGEVEGLSVYDPGIAGTNPQMQFVNVTGPAGGTHGWDIWQIDLKTQYEAAGTAGFILRTTKPSEANVGAGILRNVTNTITPAGGVYTVTTKQTIKDTLIKGQVVVKASGVIFENCIIEGPQSNPGDANTKPGVTYFVVNTNDAANATTPPVFRYCTIYQKFNCPIINAFSNRNVTVEYCNIYNVVDCFSPDPGNSGSNDVKMTIRGNYMHDFVFYAGTGSGHPPASNLNTVAGNYVNGQYRALGWTHCDAIQIQNDATTGLNVYGNNIVALWSRDKTISMMPLPYDNHGDVVVKELSCFMINGGKNLIIEDNWLDGGEECINNADSTATGAFRRNKFGRRMDKPLGLTGTTTTDDPKYWALCAKSGFNIYETDAANRNVWEDTGNVVNRHA